MGSAVLPGGGIEVVNYAMDVWFDEFSARLKAEPLHKMGMTDRIRSGVLLRLDCVKPYQRQWAEGMALGLEARNVSTTATKIARIADEIWFTAGD